MFFAPPDLDDLRWKARPVVVWGSGSLAIRQRRILRHPGTRERDIVVLAGTPALARKLNVRPGAFLFVLVGKDGGVKLRSTKVVERRRLYEIIDAMPMRQGEMKRRG